MKRMFVIHGQEGAGKARTMWLVLCHLLENGAKLCAPMFHADRPLTYEQVMQAKTPLKDFGACVEWQGHRIMLHSASDHIEHPYWGLYAHMRTAEKNNADYVVCCTRYRYDADAAFTSLLHNHDFEVRNEDWLWLDPAANETDQLQECDRMAIQIVAKLHAAIMKNSYRHYRVLFPIGKGGFAYEHIGERAVIFDCGSSSSPMRVEMYIDIIKNHGVKQVDYLFISHFDEDHVNGIRYLLNSGIRVVYAVMSFIPHDLRVVFNVATRYAYDAIRNLIVQADGRIIEVPAENRDQNEEMRFGDILWEWIAKSMLSNGDFSNLRTEFAKRNINTQKLNDPQYVERSKEEIQKAFKIVFGDQGPNAKGLIMLSQKTKYARLVSASLCNTIHHHPIYTPSTVLGMIPDKTSCLYAGDAMLKKDKEVQDVEMFLQKYCSEPSLLMMQLPHHGSMYNINPHLHNRIIADTYFVNDISDARIKKSSKVYQDLSVAQKLYMVRDISPDLIMGQSVVM